jgi:hypothetical protein
LLPLPFTSFPSPPSLPPIGSYIQSTQSGHGVTICWHCFCSQLQVAEWRQIRRVGDVGGNRGNLKKSRLSQDPHRLNSNKQTEQQDWLHIGDMS